ncbi:DNA-binding transcriptional LysR family regulator [Rhodoferax ferrireducens]|uniref:DNA-binding transcriptional LysR family regulator n=1 Tax=Rhodoferax ferrireducens TaxID=192843 RepID=A0ABU2CAE9_9BURK|nr:LysR family transcriptional regulator [Rhodoferax ferrireducens]MDR7378320.1 DNA-binding transcriptional LysR family regulator [Rhodoferax ferrireducens]
MSNLRGIETFVRAVEGGSIAAAARQLGISAAAASQNLGRLEKELGTRLLTRTTRSQALTAAGEVYFAQVGPLLDGLAQAQSELSALQDAVQGRLKLSCAVAFGRHMVAPLMPAFMARYPRVHLEMLMVDRNVDHLKEDVDASIRFRHVLEPGLVARRIATAPMVFCAAPAYLQQHGRPTTPEDLAHHPCLAFRLPLDGRLMQWPFLRDGVRFAPAIQTAAVCNDIDTLAALAVAGAGVARLGSFIANPLIAAGKLEPLFLGSGGRGRTRADPEPLEYFACFRDRQHLPVPVRVFVDFIAEALQDHPLLRAPVWPQTA